MPDPEISKDQELTLLRAELWQINRLASGGALGPGDELSPLGVRVRGLVRISAAVAQLCAPRDELPESTDPRVLQLREEIQQAMLARIAETQTH